MRSLPRIRSLLSKSSAAPVVSAAADVHAALPEAVMAQMRVFSAQTRALGHHEHISNANNAPDQYIGAHSDPAKPRDTPVSKSGGRPFPECAPTGSAGLDRLLRGALRPGSVHEIMAMSFADQTAAAGLAIAFAACVRTAPTSAKPLLWIRLSQACADMGRLCAAGLDIMGFAPHAVIGVSARSVTDALYAAEEGARCAALGAVVLELYAPTPKFDLTASRRLSMAAKAHGVAVFVVRGAVPADNSAADTRWQIKAVPGAAISARRLAYPRFALTLMRHRTGPAGNSVCVEWRHDAQRFADADVESASLPRGVVPLSVDRAPSPPEPGFTPARALHPVHALG